MTWDRHAILAAIRRRGETLRSISRRAGLSKDACACALSGRRWPKAEQAIADFLGMDVRELFPDRYRAAPTARGKGNRKGSVRKVKNQQRTLTARRPTTDREAA